MVSEFHRRRGTAGPAQPTPPSASTLALRRSLISEEAAEVLGALDNLSAASDEARLAALVHELADLLYVTYGAFVEIGVDADAVFAEVHRANMRKLPGPRRADGKQLRPQDWEPADVTAVAQRLRRKSQGS